jgi:hypothetical protein
MRPNRNPPLSSKLETNELQGQILALVRAIFRPKLKPCKLFPPLSVWPTDRFAPGPLSQRGQLSEWARDRFTPQLVRMCCHLFRVSGFRVSGFGLRVSGFGLSCFMFRVSGFGCNLMGFSASGFGVSAFALRAFVLRVSGFVFQVQPKSRASGFGFRVSGSVFLVSGTT